MGNGRKSLLCCHRCCRTSLVSRALRDAVVRDARVSNRAGSETSATSDECDRSDGHTKSLGDLAWIKSVRDAAQYGRTKATEPSRLYTYLNSERYGSRRRDHLSVQRRCSRRDDRWPPRPGYKSWGACLHNDEKGESCHQNFALEARKLHV